MAQIKSEGHPIQHPKIGTNVYERRCVCTHVCVRVCLTQVPVYERGTFKPWYVYA